MAMAQVLKQNEALSHSYYISFQIEYGMYLMLFAVLFKNLFLI